MTLYYILLQATSLVILSQAFHRRLVGEKITEGFHSLKAKQLIFSIARGYILCVSFHCPSGLILKEDPHSLCLHKYISWLLFLSHLIVLLVLLVSLIKLQVGGLGYTNPSSKIFKKILCALRRKALAPVPRAPPITTMCSTKDFWIFELSWE